MYPWVPARSILNGWKRRVYLQEDKILILHQVWERTIGPLSRYWSLYAIRRGVLYIKPSSAAAVQELQFRKTQIIRDLNKYFRRPWIKEIRAAQVRENGY